MAIYTNITTLTLAAVAMPGVTSVDIGIEPINREDLNSDNFPYPAVVNVAKKISGSVSGHADSATAFPDVTDPSVAMVLKATGLDFAADVTISNFKLTWQAGVENRWEYSFDFQTINGTMTWDNAPSA